MYKNDRTRKEILVDFGFRLPSALDNRPLTFEEFEATVHQVVYMSATPGPYELERSEKIVQQLIRPTGIVDPPITVRPTEGQIDDLLEEIRGPRRARRARARHDADQEDGRGPDRLPARARGQGPVPPQRGRHARARRDPARPAPRRLRRARRHQPAARGHRPARGHAGRHPRRRQGGLPALGLVAHPDDRPGGPQHRRRGRHVRRPRSPSRCRSRSTRPTAGGRSRSAYNTRARHRADDDHQGHPRHQRAAARGGRVDRRLRLGTAAASFSDADRAKVEALVAQMEAEMRSAAKELEFERAAALRDEIQQIRLRVLEQDASVIVGRAAERAAARRSRRADRRRRPGSRPARRPTRRRCGPVMEVTSVEVLPADEEPAETRRRGARRSTRTPSPTGCPASATSTRTTAAGRRAGWSGRPGTARSRPNIRKRTGQRPGAGAADADRRIDRTSRCVGDARGDSGCTGPVRVSVRGQQLRFARWSASVPTGDAVRRAVLRPRHLRGDGRRATVWPPRPIRWSASSSSSSAMPAVTVAKLPRDRARSPRWPSRPGPRRTRGLDAGRRPCPWRSAIAVGLIGGITNTIAYLRLTRPTPAPARSSAADRSCLDADVRLAAAVARSRPDARPRSSCSATAGPPKDVACRSLRRTTGRSRRSRASSARRRRTRRPGRRQGRRRRVSVPCVGPRSDRRRRDDVEVEADGPAVAVDHPRRRRSSRPASSATASDGSELTLTEPSASVWQLAVPAPPSRWLRSSSVTS